MRRICCLLERWESGGIESFLYNVLTRIDLAQLQVDVVVSSLGDSIFTKPLQEVGVCFFELSGSQHKVGENHRRFRLLLKERRWDVLHLNAFQGLSLYYLRIAKEAGIPVRIAHSHNAALRKSLARPLKLAVHRWARGRYTADATSLWACSRNAAEFLFAPQELEGKGYQFIPNGIDTQRFQFDPEVRERVRAELGLDGKLVIGNIGRLCEQKNQGFLLDVFAEIVKQRPESRLLLVGEGEDKPLLMQKAQRLGVADGVIFYGLSDHAERLLWAMDMFVLPSRFEGLPVTGVEAQASGLPCFFADTVTRECRISDMAVFLPLTASPLEWAEAIISRGIAADRPVSAVSVQNAGFDIAGVAREIQGVYQGACI